MNFHDLFQPDFLIIAGFFIFVFFGVSYWKSKK
jgi:hypothetical protein